MKKIIIGLIFTALTITFFSTFSYFVNSDNSGEIVPILEDKVSIMVEEKPEIEEIEEIEEIGKIEEMEIEEVDIHIPTPKNVKSLYFSAHSTNNKTKLDNFFEIAKNKEINSIMIDIKEVDGYISFDLDYDKFGDIKPKSKNIIKDIEGLIKRLHDNNIYIIARMAVFKDKRLAEVRPDLAIRWSDDWTTWTDYKGYKYTDPYSKEVWDYHVELATSVYDLGFDEINFDYVRFPTDGRISQTYYPFANEIYATDTRRGRVKVIDKFSNYITNKIRKHNPNIVMSADVFGLVTDYTMFQIGQNLESFLLAFDFVGPMVYPSHYGEGYYGYDYPDNNPYGVINTALKNASKKIDALNIEIKEARIDYRGVKLNDSFAYEDRLISDEEIKITKIRPFLQGFSCTRCRNSSLYNRTKFREQVSAVNDLGFDSWWVRSSGSNYRDVRYDESDKKILDTVVLDLEN